MNLSLVTKSSLILFCHKQLTMVFHKLSCTLTLVLKMEQRESEGKAATFTIKLKGSLFYLAFFFFNGILLHNVVLISGVQQCELAMHVNMPLPF